MTSFFEQMYRYRLL